MMIHLPSICHQQWQQNLPGVYSMESICLFWLAPQDHALHFRIKWLRHFCRCEATWQFHKLQPFQELCTSSSENYLSSSSLQYPNCIALEGHNLLQSSSEWWNLVQASWSSWTSRSHYIYTIKIKTPNKDRNIRKEKKRKNMHQVILISC